METINKHSVQLNYIDLSTNDAQGHFGHDCIDALKEPGLYKLPIRTYGNAKHRNDDTGVVPMVVEVVAIYSNNSRSQNIVVTDYLHDYDYIFYYNGNERCFKPNFEGNGEYDDILKWIDQEYDNDDDQDVNER